VIRGDIILVRNNGALFDKIRKAMRSEYDHVGIMLTENTLIDATPTSGVAVRKLEVFDGLDVKVYRLKNQYLPNIDKMLDYCLDKVGSRYDIIQTLCLYIFIILGIKKTLNPIDMQNAFVCSELVAQAAEFSGFSFNEDMATDRITPADIITSDKVLKVGE